MKTINLCPAAWLATRIFISAIGLLALGIRFTEPFGWAWRTASVIVLGIAWYLIVLNFCRLHTQTTRAAESRGGIPFAPPRHGTPFPAATAV